MKHSNLRVYYLAISVILLICIFNSLLRPKLTIVRPGDIPNSVRDLKPEEDQTPFAHEPIGLGHLRDVREEKFYRGGTLTIEGAKRPVVFDPYPDYNSYGWRSENIGSFVACDGPRGKSLSRSSVEDMVSVYPGIPKDFPKPMLGSYADTEIDGSICADRFSRLGAYGYDNTSQLDNTNWGELQYQCFEKNAARFPKALTEKGDSEIKKQTPDSASSSDVPRELQPKSRSAVILRAWHDMEWTENIKQYVRSLVMELSLHSGGEYEVFILCHVKNDTIPMNTEEETRALKAQFLPREFQDMVVLFNDNTLRSWYPGIDEHSTILQVWQPVQIFQQSFSDFDYYWQLEMDARFTGHSYHFLEKAIKFAKQQPRKYLWERNAYFYIPGAHGSWKEFSESIHNLMTGVRTIWGPKAVPGVKPIGPRPPVSSPTRDNYEWGVGEEADVITFLPIFDPDITDWWARNMTWGLPDDVPRRVSPVAMGRISKNLLQEMHVMQHVEKKGLASEMTATSVALWHGLKVVHVPQPIYADGKWTPKELARMLNSGEPHNVNGDAKSTWNSNHKFDHVLFRLNYMYSSQTAEDLYRRWLGYPVDSEQYTDGTVHQDSFGLNWFDGGDLREDEYGTLCFPSMLLHPVKNTEKKKKKDGGMVVPV